MRTSSPQYSRTANFCAIATMATIVVPGRSMGAASGELACDGSPHEAGDRAEAYFLMFSTSVGETLPAKPAVPAYDAVI